jgi:hypothetical protein
VAVTGGAGVNTATARTVSDWMLRAGWRLQRDTADVLRSALTGAPDVGRRAMRLLLATAEESADGAALLSGDRDMRGAWLELRNKVEAFRAFEHVDLLLGARVDDHSLDELVSRAASLRPPSSVWAAEGLGYHVTTTSRRSGPPGNPLAGCDRLLPSWSLIPLHSGMGSAFAAGVLEDGIAERAGLDEAVARFAQWCEAYAEPAYADIAIEALGFVARGMFEDTVPQLDQLVRALRPDMPRLLWHGVGRAAYFAPSAALPLADTRRRSLHDLVTSARHDSARTNAIAGFAWAMTLVNLRDLEVLESYAVDAVRLGLEAPFARGIHDALEVWRRCAPSDESLGAFRSHDPAVPDRREVWTRLMRAAAPRTVRTAGELFQVRDDGAPYA